MSEVGASTRARWGARLARGAAALLLVAGIAVYLWVVNGHISLGHWLVWRYLGYWFGAAAFVASAVCLGHLCVLGLLGRPVNRVLDHLALTFTLGVFGFELLVWGVGLFRGLGTVAFFALPAVCILAGGLSFYRWVRRWWRRGPLGGPPRPWTALDRLLLVLGALAFVLVYFLIITPNNIQFDARWKHLAYAEQIVVAGGERRFPEGYTFATRSHFTSFVYTWALLLPRSRLFDRLELALHLELAVFAWTTIVAIPALARRLVRNADPRVMWVVRFAFPGVFVYDAMLSGGADHFGALFAAPLALALVPALRTLSPRWCALVGVLMAGAALVKETAALMLAPVPALVIAWAWAWRALSGALGRGRPVARHWKWALVAAAGAALLASSPQWLRNWIWYHNPIYPGMSRVFHGTPWTADASYEYSYGYVEKQLWQPARTAEGVWASIKVLVTFPFVPNDWPEFHGRMPTFGALFTLLLPVAPLVRAPRRVWLLVAWVEVAIFVWYWTHHQDRYLQGLLPLMAAVAGAVVLLAWRTRSWWIRVPLVATIFLQLAWGMDFYFIKSHTISGAPVRAAIDLVSSAYEKPKVDRLDVQKRNRDLGRGLPSDAVVLLHEEHDHLGINRRVVLDYRTWQFGLSYGLAADAGETWDMLRAMGVTHVAWANLRTRSYDTLAGDFRFFELVQNFGRNRRTIGEFQVVDLPEERPAPPTRPEKVALLACAKGYVSGLYPISALRVPVFGPDGKKFPPAPAGTGSDTKQWLAEAAFAMIDEGCHPEAKEPAGFVKVADRPANMYHATVKLWVRRR